MHLIKVIATFICSSLVSLLVITFPAEAEQVDHPQKKMEIHEIIYYPDQVEIYTHYKTHVISTEAFLENHRDMVLVKETNQALYVRKYEWVGSPLSSVISIMGMKGNEALKVEKASFNPIERMNPFIQFEVKAFES